MRFFASLLLMIFISLAVKAQSYNYSYIDPCTGVKKLVSIPQGQSNIQVTYYGTVATFSQADFQNGGFTSWMNSVSAVNSSNPCGQLATAVTTMTNMTVTQNIIATLTNVTSVSTMSAGLAKGAVGVGGSASSGSGADADATSTEEPAAGESSSSDGSGTSNSISNAAESTSGESGGSSGSGGGKSSKSAARVGSLIGTGDVVVIRDASSTDGPNQLKTTVSMTKSNTKNTFAKGWLGNFTTQVNNTNVTFYGAWTRETKSLIIANSSMLDRSRDAFNTTTALGSLRYKKVSGMFGLNSTIGRLGKANFVNISAVGGGFVMFNPTQKITGTLLVLGVYSPFTQFYEGRWWSSGFLLVPFGSMDYSITKKFKFNVSISGVYQTGASMLNYQILTGGKVLL